MDTLTIRIGIINKEADEQIRGLEKCCKKGCSYCCHQAIEIVAIEETNITEYLESCVNSKTLKRIKSNLISWLDYFDKNTPDKEILDIYDLNDIEKKLATNKLPCPFLISNECSIYKVRPIVCRTHIVQDNTDECRLNVLRDPTEDAKNVRSQKLNELLSLDRSPRNHPRLLSYALTDFFSIRRNLKPIAFPLPNR